MQDIVDAFEEDNEIVESSSKKIKNETQPKKEDRQKWDAQSLKQYASSKNIHLIITTSVLDFNFITYFLLSCYMWVLGTTITEFVEMVNMGCNAECSFDKRCLSYVDIQEMYKLKETFWGKKTDRPQLPKDRRGSIQNIFRTCHANKV